MNAKRSKLSLMIVLVIASSFLILPARASAPDCRADQDQHQNRGEILFGGKTVLGQTFVPSAQGKRICRVKVMIRKLSRRPHDLTMRLLTPAWAPMADPVTIPGAAIPLGVSMQLFDFGCNDAPLNGAFHALQLESATSSVGDFAWRGSGINPYVQPANGGRGWRNVNSGAGADWMSLGNWDFMFEVYTCD